MFDIIHGGTHNGLPAVCWALKDDLDPRFNLYDFSDRLRMHGWLVPAYSMPANRADLVVQRVLVRHGFSPDLVRLFLENMRCSLTHLEKHPVSNSLSESEAGCYDHSGRRHAQPGRRIRRGAPSRIAAE